jgi:hypothetical protein
MREVPRHQEGWLWAPVCFPEGRSEGDFASPSASSAPAARRMRGSSFSAPACSAHRQHELQRVWQPHEPMRRIETGCRLVQCIDDHHRRSDRAGTLEGPLERIGQKDRAQTLSLPVLCVGQPADQGGGLVSARAISIAWAPVCATLQPPEGSPLPALPERWATRRLPAPIEKRTWQSAPSGRSRFRARIPMFQTLAAPFSAAPVSRAKPRVALYHCHNT